MIFAHILLPAILFAICKAQPYHDNSNSNNNNPQQLYTSNVQRPSIEEYRRLVVNSVARMKDSCRVYDYLLDVDKQWTEDDAKLEVAPYGGTETIRSNRDFFIDTLLRILGENANDESGNDSESNTLFNIILTKLFLTDAKLESQLVNLLRAKCCRDSGDTLNCLEKREPRTIKKVKFHSWGGKRDGSNGNENIPKIVLRTPFRPWGGKRSRLSAMLADDEWENVSS